MSPTAIPGATFLSIITLTFGPKFFEVFSLVISTSKKSFPLMELVRLALENKKDEGNVNGSMPSSRMLSKYPSTTGDTNHPDFLSLT